MAKFVGLGASAGAPGEVHSSQLNELGAIRTFINSSGVPEEYVYLQGLASVADGVWVIYTKSGTVLSLLGTGLKGDVAIATAAVVASTYGWFLISGSDTASCESSILSNAFIFAKSGATGKVDDAAVASDQVIHAVTRSAGVAGGTATVDISRPYIGVHNLLGQSA